MTTRDSQFGPHVLEPPGNNSDIEDVFNTGDKSFAMNECPHCAGAGPDPGWIYTENNGPIVRCPFCEHKPAVGEEDEMNETKWTPGPWEWEGRDEPFSYTIFAKAGPLNVCPAIAHGLGNARLIAAAPDLYAALERALALSKPRLQHEADCSCSYHEGCAALAKARGDQP